MPVPPPYAYLSIVPLLPLQGHDTVRRRLADAASRGTLPASLLLEGQQGVGKQRLAIWLAQYLLCAGSERPCGSCQHCRFALQLTHPDLHWFFPRPRLKDSDASIDEVKSDSADARAERVAASGLYAAPSGSDGLFIATTRLVVQQAGLSPALAARKVFIIGDAERMVPQEGSEFAANAFLKLLEEPLPDTHIILTSSEPGALLPTIRSRVASVRVAPLPDADVRAFVELPPVAEALDALGVPAGTAERVALAAGSIGSLFGRDGQALAADAAKRVLAAATSADPSQRYRVALAQGVGKARGAFADSLDELTALLHARARCAVGEADDRLALGASRAVPIVEEAKVRANGNVNPQLVSAVLMRDLRDLVG